MRAKTKILPICCTGSMRQAAYLKPGAEQLTVPGESWRQRSSASAHNEWCEMISSQVLHGSAELRMHDVTFLTHVMEIVIRIAPGCHLQRESPPACSKRNIQCTCRTSPAWTSHHGMSVSKIILSPTPSIAFCRITPSKFPRLFFLAISESLQGCSAAPLIQQHCDALSRSKALLIQHLSE